MSDNVQLNEGGGGDLIRTLDDGVVEWPVGVATYATTLSPGANVLQVVTPSHGLPVAQQGVWSIEPVGLAAGQTVGVDGPVAVIQDDPGSLLATVHQGGSWTVSANQSGTWEVAIADDQTIGVTQSGTWNVGTLTSITNAVTVAQPTAANLNATAVLAAGTALVGRASIGQDTSTIYDGTTALTPKYAIITASSSGNTQVVAAVSGKHIRIVRWSVTSNATVNVALRSGASTQISGVKYLIGSASGGGAYCPVGICQTAVNEALNINLSGAASVSGELTYVEVG